MLQKQFDETIPALIRADDPDGRALLGVSGGMDSMCMADLFLHSRHSIRFGIAHVNFHLRGEESDLDEALVKEWARRHGLPFFSADFDTSAYAREHALSTEMAARELRYDWFAKLMDEEGYDYLAIAHNQNDSAETFFLNLLRGAGIKGLTGIRRINGRIIRPLLDIPRSEIAAYILRHQIPYRDDRTNFENCFSRNKLRNIVFPELEKINPSFLNTVTRSAACLLQAGKVLDRLRLEKEGSLYTEEDGEMTIDIAALMQEASPEYWLFTLLEGKGFNGAQAGQIARALQGQSGRYFLSRTHRLVLDRGVLRVYPIEEPVRTGLEVPGPGDYCFADVNFRIEVFEPEAGFSPVPHHGELYFDADLVRWPMICRSWRKADRFRPFGMKNGFKKISDFYTDMKFGKREKDRQPLLLNGEDIVCLPGLRSDDRYKIKDRSHRVAMVSILK